MNERLVFFCDRDQRPCHLYRWGATEGDSSYLYQVYCYSALDKDPQEQPGQRLDLAGLIDQVAAAGGGLVAETRQTGDLVVLNVQTASAPGYEPAQCMVMLAPGQEAKPIAIDGRGITLTVGELALVPATAMDEGNLAALIEHLKRLPGDYRGLVLDVLRQPGIAGDMRRLTLRINELMQRLSQPPADRSPATRDGSATGSAMAPGAGPRDQGSTRQVTPQARVVGFWPWLLAGLLVLNLAGLAVGSWLLPGRTAQQIGSATLPAEKSPQIEATDSTADIGCDAEVRASHWQSPYAEILVKAQAARLTALAGELEDCQSKLVQAAATTTAPLEQATDPKLAINDLIETWMIQAYGWPKQDPRRIVAETHFSDSKGQAIYTPDWLTDAAGSDATADFKRRERIAYAIAKLLLIKNGISVPKAQETLKDADARTNTKKAVAEGLQVGDGRRLSDDDQQLLAWLACNVFSPGKLDNKAGFVKVSEDDPDGSDVDLGLACDNLNDDEVLAAIQHYRDGLTSIGE